MISLFLKKINFFKIFNDYLIYLIILGIGILYSYFSTKLVVSNLISYTSEITELQFICISFTIFVSIILILLNKFTKINLKVTIKLILEFSYIFAGGLSSGFLLKSYSTQVIPPGAFYGDMTNLLFLSDDFAVNRKLNLDYPPGVPLVLSLLAKSLNSNVVNVSIIGWFIIGFLQPFILLKIWQKITNPYVGILICSFLYYFEFHNYKSVALSFLIPSILYLANFLYKQKSINKNKDNLKRIQLFLFGIFFSLTQILYWAYLYWMLFFIVFCLFIISIKFSIFQKKLFVDFIFGFSIIFLIIFNLKYQIISFNYFYISLFFLIYLYIHILQKKLFGLFFTLLPILLSISLSILFLKTLYKDKYFYDEATQVPNLSSFQNLGLTILFFSVIIFLSLKSVKLNRFFVILTGIALSSFLEGLYFAAKMFSTGFVNLWPRSIQFIHHILGFMIAILISYLIFTCVIYFVQNNKFRLKNTRNLSFIFIIWFNIYVTIQGGNYLKTIIQPLELTNETCVVNENDGRVSDYYTQNGNLPKYVIQKCHKLHNNYIFPNIIITNLEKISGEDWTSNKYIQTDSISSILISRQPNFYHRGILISSNCSNKQIVSIKISQEKKLVFSQDLEIDQKNAIRLPYSLEKFVPYKIDLQSNSNNCKTSSDSKNNFLTLQFTF